MDELEDILSEVARLELIFACCHPALALEAQRGVRAVACQDAVRRR
jgi:predicted RNA polymerase sigma factor